MKTRIYKLHVCMLKFLELNTLDSKLRIVKNKNSKKNSLWV